MVLRVIVRDFFSGKELIKFFILIVLVGNFGLIVVLIVGGVIFLFIKWNGVFIVLVCIGVILIFMVFLKLSEMLLFEKCVFSNLL